VAPRDFDEAIRINPGLRAAWSGRCWSRAILGALQAALEDCDKALQTDLGSAAAYDSRGLIHLKMGKLSAAIGDYNSALRLDPKLASALYGRGFAKLRTGAWPMAMTTLRRQGRSMPRSLTSSFISVFGSPPRLVCEP
jgi:tetratricopeptide (TPR) repeat protein